MAKPSTTYVIEIETGVGDPVMIPIALGEELPPLSIGPRGMWHVEAEDLLDVHAFVYFDGDELFLRSADKQASARVDGTPVGTSWVGLRAPCRISLGKAQLVYRSTIDDKEDDDDKATEAYVEPPVRAPAKKTPPPAEARPRATPAPRETPSREIARAREAPASPPLTFPKSERSLNAGAFSSPPPQDESTRIAPVETMRMRIPDLRSEPPPPRARVPSNRPQTRSGFPPPNLPPIEGERAPSWYTPAYELVARRKLVVVGVACIFLVVAVALRLATYDGTPATSAATEPTTVTLPPPPTPIVTATAPIQTTAPIVTATAPIQTTAPVQTATAMPTVSAQPAPAPTAVTLERQAIDDVFLGHYGSAATKYTELQRQHPDNRAYAEAVRILRAKAGDAGL